jgi:hypothetical protein
MNIRVKTITDALAAFGHYAAHHGMTRKEYLVAYGAYHFAIMDDPITLAPLTGAEVLVGGMVCKEGRIYLDRITHEIMMEVPE